MPLFPKIPNELLISHGEKPRSHGSRWRMVQWSGEPGWLASRGCSWDHAEILHMFTQILDTRKAWSMFSPDACDQSQDLALVRIQMHNPLFVWRFLQLMEDIWMFHRSSYSSPCDHQLVAWWCAKQGMIVLFHKISSKWPVRYVIMFEKKIEYLTWFPSHGIRRVDRLTPPENSFLSSFFMAKNGRKWLLLWGHFMLGSSRVVCQASCRKGREVCRCCSVFNLVVTFNMVGILMFPCFFWVGIHIFPWFFG